MKTLIFVFLFCTACFYTIGNVAMADKANNKVHQMQMATVNLNTATLDELTMLPGVGKKKAAAIIEYRNRNGKFKSVDDLTKVKGVGAKMLAKLKGRLDVS